MKRLGAMILALAISGCMKQPMTKREFARSAASVGAAIVITTAIVIAETRDAAAVGQPERSLR